LSSFIVTIDQGSSATKVLAFDQQGRQTYRSSRSLKIDRPQPTHVEQDPIHVFKETRYALEEVLSSIYTDGHDVISIGLACQRSSFLLWDRERGNPYTPIISWQDLRAKNLCTELVSKREIIYKKTGLPLTGHYGGPKFLWLVQNDPEVSKWLTLPGIIFSPWNSFLLWHLTEERVCATDESIAGRTLFFNIHERSWDEELVHLFKIPKHILPEIRPTCHLYGHYKFKNRSIPIACSVGDHQGALLGLGGFQKGQCGLNYGTSGGVLINIGSVPCVVDGLLTNIAYSTQNEVVYTAEGTVNAVGSLFEWFEREKSIIGASVHWDEQVAPSSQGWYMVPGMYGIAAPYWKETAPTEFKGEGGVPTPEVLLRVGMESIAFLVADILDKIKKIPGLKIDRIIAAGGAARRPLLQFQADLLGQTILHSSIADATALGCAFLTGIQTSFWKDIKGIQDLIHGEEAFHPQISSSQRQALLDRWHELLRAKGILPDPAT
jgi:glycerol kinase